MADQNEQTPPADPITRIANALERIAEALEYHVGAREDLQPMLVEIMQGHKEYPLRVFVADSPDEEGPL